MSRFAHQSATVRYAIYGALFGCMFPIGATLFDLWQRHQPLTFTTVRQAYASQPLLWIIATAPFFLGMFAALAGYRQDLLEQTNTALREQQHILEQRVAERTTHLEQALAQTQALVHTREQLLQTIQALSVPVLPIWQRVLLLPLIGVLDDERMNLLLEGVLAAIREQRAVVVILDVTGVPALGEAEIALLTRTAQAIGLLGAHPVLVGLRPPVASAISAANLDLSAFVVRNSLQSGLSYAIDHVTGR